MIYVCLVSDDKAFSAAIKNYIESARENITVLNITDGQSAMSQGSLQANSIDLFVIDVNIPKSVSEAVLSKYAKNKPVLYITEDVKAESRDSIYKYLTAERFTQKLMESMKGTGQVKDVKHYVFASSYASEYSFAGAKRFEQMLREKGNAPLIISLDSHDMPQTWSTEMIPNPFGRFQYYAGLSAEKFSEQLDSLIFKHGAGYDWIPKPYPFDGSEWNEVSMTHVIEALKEQTIVDAVIWNLGSQFSFGFKPLYMEATQIFWVSQWPEPADDPVLHYLNDLCGIRLELKTSGYWAGEGESVFKEQDISELEYWLNSSKDGVV